MKGVSLMNQGYLTIVLHAHLPFVRHPESEDYLEERWLFEALTDSYIPLLLVLEGLLEDGIDFSLTMSLSPTLVSMLTDNLLQRRYLNHLSNLIELAEKEVQRTENSEQMNQLADEYLLRFRAIRAFYVRYDGNLVNAFRAISDAGNLELITTAATHAFLPLVGTQEAVFAQIATAVEFHERNFGQRPKGIWLPECAYTPGLDAILRECGIEFFFVDSHGLSTANPKPVFGTFAPVVTPHGVAAFARDQDSSKQVWSATEGFPGNPTYREYYRDLGFDLDFETVRPYIHSSGIRVNTGIKYYRITGNGSEKQLYSFHEAKLQASQDADTFLLYREKQVEYWSNQIGRKPIIVAPYDAELFGHWWYEGPLFLNQLFRKMHQLESSGKSIVKPITPSAYLRLYTDYQVCDLSLSSWGRGGYAEVWLRGENDWVYPALHTAEQQMIQLSDLNLRDDITHRALKQAARELMLAESSDWAFIMDNKTMVDYAVKRTKYHINRFSRLYRMIRSNSIEPEWLRQLEDLDNLFPEVDVAHFRSRSDWLRRPVAAVASSPRFKVLILTWEFPPLTVGGLSRHVYDLSRYLIRHNIEVHVVTQAVEDRPDYAVEEGVHVHRVQIVRPDGGEFIHYALQLNLMILDRCQALLESGLEINLIHAHDWLVSYAAQTLKERHNLPLIATIHATEHGRNQGIHTDLQRYIHHLEWELTYQAERVIVCSSFMKNEVIRVFELPPDKVDILPNGVDPHMLFPLPIMHTRAQQPTCQPTLAAERVVLFVGRLVREKGVHVLLEAAPTILQQCPAVKFVIVGTGPMESELHQLAWRLQVNHRVEFTGFVSDERRNQLFQEAEIAVFPSLYEPFGIVALEAMAAMTPVVVSDAGGLDDLVQHRHNGLKTYAGDPASLACQVNELLRDTDLAHSLAQTARVEMMKYDWNEIANETIQSYMRVMRHQQDSVHGAATSASYPSAHL